MRLSSDTFRAATGGLALAALLSFATASIAARTGCPASTACAEGTALYGFEIECDCLGPGSCWVESSGHEVRCACEEHELTICDCENGCN
jgi:hypothetical protein